MSKSRKRGGSGEPASPPEARRRLPRDQRLTSRDWGSWVALAGIVALTAAAYLPALANGFVHYDDSIYITDNPLIRSLSPRNIWAILVRPYAEFYHPVTLLSLALDRALWGLNPFGYHLTDLILHLLNTVLVFWVSYRLVTVGTRVAAGSQGLARPSAMIAAALFSLHPLHVESVAWAAQRKDLLCAFFYLLSFGLYLRHAETEPRPSSRRWLRASFVAFLLALLSKSMAMTLPLAMALADIYPLRRLRSWPGRAMAPDEKAACFEKVPFFGLAAAMLIATLAAQAHGGAIRSASEIPLGLRPWIAVHSYAFYLWKAIVPTGLTIFYPVPLHVGLRDVATWIALAALLAITMAAWRLRKRWPALPAAWVYYLLTLAPVCGFLTFGAQSVADRYSYLSLLGLVLVAGVGVARFSQIGGQAWRLRVRVLSGAAATVAVMALAHLTRQQIAYWHDGVSLWSHHLRIFPDSSTAYLGRGAAHGEFGAWDNAIADYSKAIELKPDYAEAYVNRGMAYGGTGALDQAVQDFTKAIALKPDFAAAYINRADTLNTLGQYAQAIRDCDKAIELRPGSAEPYVNRGNAYGALGDGDRALAEYSRAIELKPDYANAYANRGVMYSGTGAYDRALRDLTRAIALKPDFADAYGYRADALNALGQFAQAVRDCDKAIELRPSSARPYVTRGNAHRALGDRDRALADYSRAIELNPGLADARNNRGAVYLLAGAYDRAVQDFTKAIELRPNSANAYSNRAMAFYYLKDYDRAWADVKVLETLGEKPSPRLLEILRKGGAAGNPQSGRKP